MLKRERSSFEKQADKVMKAGMMRLGGTNPAAETPTPFPHVLVWDRAGRKGQRCKVIADTPRTVQLEFEDGHTMIASKQAIRRK